MKSRITAILALLTAPLLSLAQPRDFVGFAQIIITLSNAVTRALFAAAVAAFLYGVGKTILQSGDTEAVADGRRIMIFGGISLLVIATLWGVIALVRRSFFGY